MAALPGVLGEPIRFVLNWGRRYSLWVFNFGLACCAIEFIATSMGRHDFIRLGVIPFAHGPRQADLMVVSGTVTDKMAPAIKRLYDQMPEPKYVISFGACSNCGGPYWDSYAVTKGVDQLIPVDVYVPGCPPRPEALLHGILRLQERIAAEESGLGGVDRLDPLSTDGRAEAAALSAPPVRPPEGVVVPQGVVWHRRAPAPRGPAVGPTGRLPITELLVDRAGASAPFGDDQVLPLPPEQVGYQHPTRED
jgi:NADH-quinone oxidoreductase subunit B